MCILIVFKIFSFSISCLCEKNLREMLSVPKVVDPKSTVLVFRFPYHVDYNAGA